MWHQLWSSSTVSTMTSAKQACEALLEDALEGGGTDNITVIMAELAGPGLPAAEAAAGIEYKEYREEDFKPRS